MQPDTYDAYPPRALKRLKVNKLSCHGIVAQAGLVLFEETRTSLGVLQLSDRILDICLF